MNAVELMGCHANTIQEYNYLHRKLLYYLKPLRFDMFYKDIDFFSIDVFFPRCVQKILSISTDSWYKTHASVLCGQHATSCV